MWGTAERYFFTVVPLIMFAATIFCIATRQGAPWCAIDTLACIIWLEASLSAWMITDSPCTGIWLKWSMLLVLYFALRLQTRTLSAIMMVCAVLVTFYEVVYGGLQMLNIIRSNHKFYVLTGTFQNPGPYGGFLAVMAAISGSWYMKEKRVLALFCLLLCLIVLPSTMSRAAILSFAFAMIVYLAQRNARALLWSIICLVAAAFLLYIIRQGSADGRLLINLIGFSAVNSSPWFGTGLGSFLHTYSEHLMPFLSRPEHEHWKAIVSVPDYAFNEWLHVAVEQGFIGCLLWGSLAAITLRRLWRSGSPWCYGAIALCVFSLFSYPMHLLPFQLLVVVMLAIATQQEEPPKFQRMKKKRLIIVASMLTLFSAIIYQQARPRLDAIDHYRPIRGMTSPAFSEAYKESASYLREYPHFLFDYAKLLRASGNFNESNFMLQQGRRVSADPMFLIVMGNNYKSMGAYAQAASTYKLAAARYPNRVYPLHQLMQLYVHTGNMTDAKTIARLIVNMTPKIMSPATEQMKENAAKLLDE